MTSPSRGEIWLVDLDPVIGREQAGSRPALVLSVDKFNHGPSGLAVVLPVTSKNKAQPLHVAMLPPEGGMKMQSFIKTEDIRSISQERLQQFLGRVSSHTIDEVERRVRVLLGL